jgi:hypothetical protein
MKVQQKSFLRQNLKNNLAGKNKEQSRKKENEYKAKPMSYMSIPAMAFMGRVLIPRLHKNKKIEPEPVIRSYYTSDTISEPIVKFRVYPQDSLVTPNPEIYLHKGYSSRSF